jgi:hypothetical protein
MQGGDMPEEMSQPQARQDNINHRSGSQDVLDEAKLEHVLPRFFEAVGNDQRLSNAFREHFETPHHLRKLSKKKQFATTTCSLMKMVIDYVFATSCNRS